MTKTPQAAKFGGRGAAGAAARRAAAVAGKPVARRGEEPEATTTEAETVAACERLFVVPVDASSRGHVNPWSRA